MNGSKTEIMSKNSDRGKTLTSNLGYDACKVGNKSKVLGLFVDNACSFEDHTEMVVARSKDQWRVLRIRCSDRWGLYRNTLTVLHKTRVPQ